MDNKKISIEELKTLAKITDGYDENLGTVNTVLETMIEMHEKVASRISDEDKENKSTAETVILSLKAAKLVVNTMPNIKELSGLVALALVGKNNIKFFANNDGLLNDDFRKVVNEQIEVVNKFVGVLKEIYGVIKGDAKSGS